MQTVSWEIEIKRPSEEVFAFHADLLNIEKVLPPFLKLQLEELEYPCGVDTKARFKIKLFGLVTLLDWRLVFEAWQAPHFFVDREAGGIFRHFAHRHAFSYSESSPKFTIVRDTIDFDTGIDWLDFLIWRFLIWLSLVAKLKSTKAYLEGIAR
ncbi:MAG: hypothetical protein SFT81_03065 [Candidatus Caenarcaniphilales bacterium]|nr:hypothetical protein [Candidatus Caenarcaniphilales bacterium]